MVVRQRVLEKLQGCCDQFEQRFAASENGGSSGGNGVDENPLVFVHRVTQAGASMVARLQSNQRVDDDHHQDRFLRPL